jgi:DNA-binding MarR family transcriptional regulator
MVPFVGRLERRGFIKRRKVDGRSQGLFLSAAGRTVLAKTRTIVEDHEAALIERVPPTLRAGVLPTLMALWNGRAPELEA